MIRTLKSAPARRGLYLMPPGRSSAKPIAPVTTSYRSSSNTWFVFHFFQTNLTSSKSSSSMNILTSDNVLRELLFELVVGVNDIEDVSLKLACNVNGAGISARFRVRPGKSCSHYFSSSSGNHPRRPYSKHLSLHLRLRTASFHHGVIGIEVFGPRRFGPRLSDIVLRIDTWHLSARRFSTASLDLQRSDNSKICRSSYVWSRHKHPCRVSQKFTWPSGKEFPTLRRKRWVHS